MWGFFARDAEIRTLQEKTSRLDSGIEALRSNQKSSRIKSLEINAETMAVRVRCGTLTADMILDRFEELYEYLGIERKELPKNNRTHKLVKKQTKGNR